MAALASVMTSTNLLRKASAARSLSRLRQVSSQWGSRASWMGVSLNSADCSRLTRTQREIMVWRSWSGWEVDRMSRHWLGGSSRVFRKALAASSFMRSASMNTAIFHFPSAARCWRKGSTARMSSRRMRRDLDLGRTRRQYSSRTPSRCPPGCRSSAPAIEGSGGRLPGARLPQ